MPRYHSLIPWRRHLFLDCGGHNGCSVRRFRNEFDPDCRFDIVTFEPNPIYADRYAEFPRHGLIQAAVYNRDGEAPFYLDREDGDGSTLFENKLTAANGGYGTLDTARPVAVRTVDLSNWLRQNTSIFDYIILKLDVEGAEYAILEKMLRDRTIRRLTHLFIEWHWYKIGLPEKTHRDLLSQVGRHVPILEWDAQGC